VASINWSVDSFEPIGPRPAIDPWMRQAARRLTVVAGDSIRVRRCTPGAGRWGEGYE